MKAHLTVILLLAGLFWAGDSPAVQPDERLSDPALEARARELSKDIRCLVCQNQSIDDSNAGLARDLRILVRERLTAGDSDQEIFDFLVARYGDFVLLKPPVKASTYALWFGPLVVFVLALAGLIVFFRRRAQANVAQSTAAALTSEERARLSALLDDDEKDQA
jgi:cytochrome c-type biogenesis protein CcmH